MKIYQAIPHYLQAIENCKRSNNEEWQEKHELALHNIMQTSPSGSGFDNGTVLDETRTNDKRIVFHVGFHHMNENGYYTCWTTHEVWVTATFGSFDLRITGRNKNDIKEYIADTFVSWLMQDC